MRKNYVEELEKLKEDVVEMGNAIEAQVTLSMEAFLHRNIELAKSVIDGDREVNQMERKIEDRCLTLILTQQPVASDLRLISAALKMVTDMERIRSNARSIAYFTVEGNNYKDLQVLPKMAEIATKMVHDAVDAFVSGDISKVHSVIETDNILDKYYRDAKSSIVELIKAGNVSDGDMLIELLIVSRYLERIGDHSENIVDWIHYYLQGSHIKKETEI